MDADGTDEDNFVDVLQGLDANRLHSFDVSEDAEYRAELIALDEKFDTQLVT